jgi:hypothetical protein
MCLLVLMVLQYQFKYMLKSTQKVDTAAYSFVVNSKKCLQSRVHENDKSEAIRLICRAAFAHNRGNIIGAAMASYLTCHEISSQLTHSHSADQPIHHSRSSYVAIVYAVNTTRLPFQ